MAQIRGTAGYNLGNSGRFGGEKSDYATNDPSPLDAIREQTSKIEDWLNAAGEPLKPYVSLHVLLKNFFDGNWSVMLTNLSLH